MKDQRGKERDVGEKGEEKRKVCTHRGAPAAQFKATGNSKVISPLMCVCAVPVISTVVCRREIDREI